MKNKNILLSAVVFSLATFSASAQVNRSDTTLSKTQIVKAEQTKMNDLTKSKDQQEQHLKIDHIMMKDQKMMVIKDGKMMLMEKEMTLKNGTKCLVNGTCISSDGKKSILKEGEMMDMNGNMLMVLKNDNKP